MDDDIQDLITVKQPSNDQSTRISRLADDRRRSHQIYGWCRRCGHFLFLAENRWNRLNHEYVAHAQGDSVTATLEGSLELVEDEYDGSKDLEGCRLKYLKCGNCSDKLGLHCTRGTREKRYKNLTFLRLRKIIIKKNTKSPENLEFEIVGSGADNETETATGTRSRNAAADKPKGDIPIREKSPKDVAQNLARSTSEEAEACVPCRKRHMKCDRKGPSCETCVSSGYQCNWRRAPPAWTHPGLSVLNDEPGTDVPPAGSMYFTPKSSVPPPTSPGGPAASAPVHDVSESLPPMQDQPSAANVAYAGARTPNSPTDTTKKSASRCNQCVKRRRNCSRTLPECEGCKKHGRRCAYGYKRSGEPNVANTIDILDPKSGWQSDSVMPLNDSDSSDDDSDIQTIPTRSRHSPEAIVVGNELFSQLSRRIDEQDRRIDEQYSAISRLQSQNKALLAELTALREQNRVSGTSLKNSTPFDVSEVKRGTARATRSFGDSRDEGRANYQDKATIARPSAPARRGGHSINNSLSRGVSSTVPNKRSFDERSSDSSVSAGDLDGRGKVPSSNSSTHGKHSAVAMRAMKDASRNSPAEFDSMYDATPPPNKLGLSNADSMDIDDITNRPTGTLATSEDALLSSTAARSSSKDTSKVPSEDVTPVESQRTDEEAETQRYLREHVRDEDSEDDDYVPANDSVDPYQSMAPDSQSVRQSVERLLTPVQPVRPSPKRGSSGRPRGRPPKYPRDGRESHMRMALLGEASRTGSVGSNGSQGSYVSSTPTPPRVAVRGGVTRRRGISGRAREVPAEFSHNAFSPSQAVTMINDPVAKRAKIDSPLAYDSTPISFAISPKSNEKIVKSRYPNGRIRDASGCLLNVDGTQDKRSLRRKPAHKPGPEPSQGWQATGSGVPPPALNEQRLAATPGGPPPGGPSPVNAGVPNHIRPVTPTTVPTASMAPQFSPVNYPHTALPASTGGLAPYASTVHSSPPNVSRLTAQAENERVMQAMTKGNDKRYGDGHYEIMAKLNINPPKK